MKAKKLTATETLFEAAYRGNHDKCRRLLQGAMARLLGRGSERSRGETGATVLHWAAAGGSRPVLRMLLERRRRGGVDINVVDTRGRTPLHWAAQAGQSFAVGTLLAAGGNARMADFDGETSLHVAARYGHVDVIEALLEALLLQPSSPQQPHVNITTTTSSSTTKNAASAAAAAPAISTASAAATSTTTTTTTTTTTSTTTSTTTTIEVELARLSSSGAGLSPLHLAALAGHDDAVAVLLDAGSDVALRTRDAPRDTALHIATRCGHGDVSGLLVDAGADLKLENDKGEKALTMYEEEEDTTSTSKLSRSRAGSMRRAQRVSLSSLTGLSDLGAIGRPDSGSGADSGSGVRGGVAATARVSIAE